MDKIKSVKGQVKIMWEQEPWGGGGNPCYISEIIDFEIWGKARNILAFTVDKYCKRKGKGQIK
jgi:hypothetical protein